MAGPHLNSCKLRPVKLMRQVVVVLVTNLRWPHAPSLLLCQLLCSFLEELRLQDQILDLQHEHCC